MDSGSDDRRVSETGEAVDRRGEEADPTTVAGDAEDDRLAAWLAAPREDPCITVADLEYLGLLPVPDWARKPPAPRQRGLFDDQ